MAHIIVRIIGFNQAELFVGFAAPSSTLVRRNQSLTSKPFANYAT